MSDALQVPTTWKAGGKIEGVGFVLVLGTQLVFASIHVQIDFLLWVKAIENGYVANKTSQAFFVPEVCLAGKAESCKAE